jgi:PAS domain-containing protein
MSDSILEAGSSDDRPASAETLAENERLELEARRDMAQAFGDVGIFRVDLAAGELVWDDVTRSFYGVPPGQRVTVELALEAVHPDDRAAVRRKLDQIMAGRHPVFEHGYRVLDHAIRRLHVRGRTIFAADGRARIIVGAVRCVDVGEATCGFADAPEPTGAASPV